MKGDAGAAQAILSYVCELVPKHGIWKVPVDLWLLVSARGLLLADPLAVAQALPSLMAVLRNARACSQLDLSVFADPASPLRWGMMCVALLHADDECRMAALEALAVIGRKAPVRGALCRRRALWCLMPSTPRVLTQLPRDGLCGTGLVVL